MQNDLGREKKKETTKRGGDENANWKWSNGGTFTAGVRWGVLDHDQNYRLEGRRPNRE